MTLECINPPDLPTPATYTQVVVAKGTKLIFVSGQEPEDIHGKLVGRGDFVAQVRQAFANLGRALQICAGKVGILVLFGLIGRVPIGGACYRCRSLGKGP